MSASRDFLTAQHSLSTSNGMATSNSMPTRKESSASIFAMRIRVEASNTSTYYNILQTQSGRKSNLDQVSLRRKTLQRIGAAYAAPVFCVGTGLRPVQPERSSEEERESSLPTSAVEAVAVGVAASTATVEAAPIAAIAVSEAAVVEAPVRK